ncbi:hypothetical protein K435DRAFT_780786 [Dendrothele bispora CBS 962.96]|uniref:Secreted protein n=1 Tax=Dendrothele bispora (strain CBS 962.96) TaxID=1314807 RepID=A0A4S8LPT0_DENBC|nr:hypothetical protein K435DRAFT_780786 [Dendrothele bispora CBS 962.96]
MCLVWILSFLVLPSALVPLTLAILRTAIPSAVQRSLHCLPILWLHGLPRNLRETVTSIQIHLRPLCLHFLDAQHAVLVLGWSFTNLVRVWRMM